MLNELWVLVLLFFASFFFLPFVCPFSIEMNDAQTHFGVAHYTLWALSCTFWARNQHFFFLELLVTSSRLRSPISLAINI